MSNDSFVVVVALLSEKLVNQAQLLDEKETEINNLRNFHYLESENERLRNEIKALQTKLYGVSEKGAQAYMDAEGLKLWQQDGGKIPVIKCVRVLTDWGLKETKEWCENYVHTSVQTVTE